jgi:hypothetical protein
MTTRKTGSSIPSGKHQDEVSRLREEAKRGNTKAADNLLVAQLAAIRAKRNSK